MSTPLFPPAADKLPVRRALISVSDKTGLIDTVRALVDLGVEFCRTLRARANPASGMPADKAFIDGLYGNE